VLTTGRTGKFKFFHGTSSLGHQCCQKDGLQCPLSQGLHLSCQTNNDKKLSATRMLNAGRFSKTSCQNGQPIVVGSLKRE